jgi:hypothetical protein
MLNALIFAVNRSHMETLAGENLGGFAPKAGLVRAFQERAQRRRQ